MVKRPKNIREYESRKSTEAYERNRLIGTVDSLQTRIKFLKNYIVDVNYDRKNIAKSSTATAKKLFEEKSYALKLARKELRERKEQLKTARSDLKRLRHR